MAVIGWKLDRTQRDALLSRFPPRWPDVIADHVTLDAKVEEATLPPNEVGAAIVGEADDGEGVQAMVVAIHGSTARPDGSYYHITWSLDRSRGRTAVESNDVIARHGWQDIDPPVPVAITPARW